MKKVPIKRVKRNKKSKTTAEKVLTGFGIGSSILGGAAGYARNQAQLQPNASTQIVGRQSQNQKDKKGTQTASEKIKNLIASVFGVEKAKADYYDWAGGGMGGGMDMGDMNLEGTNYSAPNGGGGSPFSDQQVADQTASAYADTYGLNSGNDNSSDQQMPGPAPLGQFSAQNGDGNPGTSSWTGDNNIYNGAGEVIGTRDADGNIHPLDIGTQLQNVTAAGEAEAAKQDTPPPLAASAQKTQTAPVAFSENGVALYYDSNNDLVDENNNLYIVPPGGGQAVLASDYNNSQVYSLPTTDPVTDLGTPPESFTPGSQTPVDQLPPTLPPGYNADSGKVMPPPSPFAQFITQPGDSQTGDATPYVVTVSEKFTPVSPIASDNPNVLEQTDPSGLGGASGQFSSDPSRVSSFFSPVATEQAQSSYQVVGQDNEGSDVYGFFQNGQRVGQETYYQADDSKGFVPAAPVFVDGELVDYKPSVVESASPDNSLPDNSLKSNVGEATQPDAAAAASENSSIAKLFTPPPAPQPVTPVIPEAPVPGNTVPDSSGAAAALQAVTPSDIEGSISPEAEAEANASLDRSIGSVIDSTPPAPVSAAPDVAGPDTQDITADNPAFAQATKPFVTPSAPGVADTAFTLPEAPAQTSAPSVQSVPFAPDSEVTPPTQPGTHLMGPMPFTPLAEPPAVSADPAQVAANELAAASFPKIPGEATSYAFTPVVSTDKKGAVTVSSVKYLGDDGTMYTKDSNGDFVPATSPSATYQKGITTATAVANKLGSEANAVQSKISDVGQNIKQGLLGKIGLSSSGDYTYKGTAVDSSKDPVGADAYIKDKEGNQTPLFKIDTGVYMTGDGQIYTQPDVKKNTFVYSGTGIQNFDPAAIANNPLVMIGPGGQVLTQVGEGVAMDAKGNVYALGASGTTQSTGLQFVNDGTGSPTLVSTNLDGIDDKTIDKSTLGILESGAKGGLKGLLTGGLPGVILSAGQSAVSTAMQNVVTAITAWAQNPKTMSVPGQITFSGADGSQVVMDKFTVQAILNEDGGKSYLTGLIKGVTTVADNLHLMGPVPGSGEGTQKAPGN